MPRQVLYHVEQGRCVDATRFEWEFENRALDELGSLWRLISPNDDPINTDIGAHRLAENKGCQPTRRTSHIKQAVTWFDEFGALLDPALKRNVASNGKRVGQISFWFRSRLSLHARSNGKLTGSQT